MQYCSKLQQNGQDGVSDGALAGATVIDPEGRLLSLVPPRFPALRAFRGLRPHAGFQEKIVVNYKIILGRPQSDL